MKKRGSRRGTNMRDMKARQLGRQPRTDGRGAPEKDEQGPTGELPVQQDDEAQEEPLDDGVLVDQGDGMRVLRRVPRRSVEDRETHELPDEPPEGWGDG